jgi:hypothetical protein
VLRASDSSNYYRCRLLSQALTIHKVVGGSVTQLATASFTTTAGASYWIRFRIVGTNLFAKVWADGGAEATSWLLSTTDSALSSGGFGLGATLNSLSNIASFDSFYVIDYSEISQLLTFSAEATVTANQTTTITEALSLTDAISLSSEITITEQRVTFSAEATVVAVTIRYSTITFTGNKGTITFTAI